MSLVPAALLAFALAVPPPAAASAAELILEERSGHIVQAEINGFPLRLKVMLDHFPSVQLNATAAARAGLGKGDGKTVNVIGPIRLPGRSAERDIVIAGKKVRADLRWYESRETAGADGTVSAHLLPFNSVTLERRGASTPERDLLFTVALHEDHGIHVPVPLGERKIAVRFSLDRDRTVAMTAAAAVIAEHHGGAFGDGKTMEEITGGVLRPARRLHLQRPFMVGELQIPALMARTADFRGKHQLPQTPGSSVSPPKDTILVTGRPIKQNAGYRVTLGLDVLGRCSSATYNRFMKTLRLRCASR